MSKTKTSSAAKKKQSYKTIAQRYARQLAVVQDINRILGSNEQTDTALTSALEHLLNTLGYQAIQIYRLSPSGSDLWLYLESGHGTKPVTQNKDIFSIDEHTIISDSARNRKPVYIPEIKQSPYSFYSETEVEINSEVAVPIQYGAELLGVLRVQSSQADHFEETDISFLDSVAGAMASAIKNTQVITGLQNDLQEIKILYNLQREKELTHHGQGEGSQAGKGYEYDGQTVALSPRMTPAAKTALSQKQPPQIIEDDDQTQMIAPIQLHGETIGVLGVEGPDGDEWTENDLNLIVEASTQVALAIESSSLLQQTQKRTQELSILFEATRRLSETVELQRIYHILTDQIINYLNADVCRLSLINGARTHFETVSKKYRNQANEVTADNDNWVDAIDDLPIFQEILKQPDFILTHLDDAQLDKTTQAYLKTQAGREINMHAVFPVIVRHNLIGVLQVSHFEPRQAYTENELQLAQAIIAQVTVAVENAQLFEQTEAALSETQKLYMISRALVETDSLDETFEIVLETIKSYDIDRVSISLLDRAQSGDIETVTIVASWDRESARILPVGSKISADMFSLVETFAQPPFHPLISEDLSRPDHQDERMDNAFRLFMYEGLGAVTMFSTPMFLGTEYKGVLSISTRRPHTYTEQEVRIYQTLADQTIIAIENYRLFEVVRRERDQAALLYEIGQSLSQAITIDKVQETLLSYTQEIGAAHSEICVTDGKSFSALATTIPERQQADRNKLADLILTKGIEAQVLHAKKTTVSNRSKVDWTIEGVPDPEDMNMMVCTPFYSQRSKLKGTLTFYHPQEDAFTNETVALLESVAIQVVSALENVWLLEQTTTALNETEVLYRATGEFSRAQNPQDLLNILGENLMSSDVQTNTGIDYMAMTTLSALADNGSPEMLTMIAEWDKETTTDTWTDLFTTPLIPEDFSFITTLQDDEPRLFDFHQLNKKTRDNIDTYLGKARAILSVPLRVGKNWLGVLFVASRTKNHNFNPSLINQINALSGQMAVVLQNLDLVEETQKNLYYSEILSHLSQELLNSDSRQAIYNLSLDAIAATEPGRGAAIFMYDQIEMGVELEMVAIWDNPFTSDNPEGWPSVPPGARFSTAELGLESLLKTGQTVLTTTPQEDDRFSNSLKQLLLMMQINSLVAVPIWLNREVNGFILIGSHRSSSFPSDMIRHYEDIARQTSVALENHRLLEEAQHRATLLQTAAEVSQAATSYLELDTLLAQSVDLIRDRFEYYHVSIFLLDEYRKNAVVEASTGEVGRKMLAMKHKLEVGGKSIVGTATGTGQPRIALDVGEDAVWFNNPLLPDTHSEMALPLIARGQVIGALDVQSTKRGAFGESDITILQSMANQLANAIQAARSFQESREALDEVRNLHEYYLREQWEAFLKDQERSTGYRLTDEGIVEAPQDFWWPEMDQAIESKKPVVISPPLAAPDTAKDNGHHTARAKTEGEENAATVIAPLSLQNNVVIGTLDMEVSDKNQLWEEDNLSIIEAVLGQASQAIEEARLFEETQAARETAEALYRVGRTLVAADTEEQMFHTVLNEILSALGLEQGGILFFEEDRKFGRLHALFEKGQPVDPGLRFPIEDNLSYEKLIESKLPLAIEDVAADPLVETVRDINLERNIVSLLLVPIIIEDEVVGALGVDAVGEKHIFNESEINLARAMVDQLSIMLQNHRLIQETRRNALQLQTSADVGRVATSILDQEVMLGEAVELIRDRFGFYHVQVFLLDANKKYVVLNKSTGALGQELLKENHKVAVNSADVVGQAAALREPQVVRNPEFLPDDDNHTFNIPEKHKELLPDTQAELAIPLQVGDTLVGVLDVHSTSPTAFVQADISTMEILGAQLAIAIQNARVFREQQETAERLKEMDQLKTQFLANMSHELRTPLNSIIGFSRVILKGIDGPLTDLQKADLTSIHNSGQHLLGLINNMLDVAKIEAGKMELNIEEIEIEPIIKSIMSTARALVKDKNVELVQEVQENMCNVWADPTRIRQIILNLVSNACKFTEDGEVRLRAYTDDDKLTISVSDTGIGIPLEKLNHVFEEFTQVDASTTRKVGGTGLGLPISRHFVEMHGGQIWVESATGKGSTFSFSIPIKPPEKDGEETKIENIPETMLAKPDENQATTGQRKVVIAIDDDPNVVNLYQRFLEKQGYRVIGVNNSTDVFPSISQHNPSAILLDVLMPEKDGWGVLRELKDEESTRDIPVVICSIISDKDRGFSLGAADYLTKPIVEADLVKALRRLDTQDKAEVKVLVIDDEVDDVLLIRRILEAQPNYVILEASNGKEGLALVSHQKPDLIILDLTMPEMDGFTVVEKLKNNEETRTIPIIIVSAKELTPKERKFLTGEVEVLLQKGLFNEAELLEDVSQALQHIHQEKEAILE